FVEVDFYGEQIVRNPNYDPEAARQELELMRRIYNESPALKFAYSPEFDPNNPEHLARLQRMFERETGMPVQDWTGPFYYYDRQGRLRRREAGRSSSGRGPDE